MSDVISSYVCRHEGCTDKTPMGRLAILEHFRLMHPEVFAKIEPILLGREDEA